MLLVPTFLAPSPIHGIGLFARRPIRKGEVIWVFAPGFDLELTEADLAGLSAPARERTLDYSFYSKERGRYVLCSDDARFINHSETPNTRSVGFAGGGIGRTVAAENIEAADEITEDYRAFEEEGRNARYGILTRSRGPREPMRAAGDH